MIDYHDINTKQEYKQCAGKNCVNKAEHELRILYLNRSGYFCNQCAHYLLSLKIAFPLENDSDD